MSIEEESRRLRWRCRRGLLELDIVLQGFIDHGYVALSEAQLQAFDGLLDMPDNDLWALVCHSSECQNLQQREILSMLVGTEREAI